MLKPALLGCLMIMVMVAASLARDNGQWGHDEETSQWFKSLKNEKGMPCCDYVDGFRIEDPGDYRRNDDGSYEVTIGKDTIHVTPDKVLKGTNRVGYAIIWRSPANGSVYCFLPGSGT